MSDLSDLQYLVDEVRWEDLRNKLIDESAIKEAVEQSKGDTKWGEIECLGGTEAVTKLHAAYDRLQTWALQLLEIEVTCRASKKCIAWRENRAGGTEICELLGIIKDTEQKIRELQPPYRGLSREAIHARMQLLRYNRWELNTGRKPELQKARDAFRTAYKRDFPDSFCRELAAL